MKARITLIKIIVVLFFIALTVISAFLLRRTSLGEVATWQRQASPGKLSAAHTFLENNCVACHTPVKGVQAANCVVCHANNETLLARQPTAFHANITSCNECHLEHQGAERRSTQMEHLALAKIGLRELNAGEAGSEQQQARSQLLGWVRVHGAAARTVYPNVTPEEATLNCASCHSTKDKHQGLLGQNCAECHATAQWTIPAFVHPSPRSTSCAQCHQAPPSHYMMHFQMVSKSVARQPDAQVNQCYLCHQTTSWNDIKGVGWYKHH